MNNFLYECKSLDGRLISTHVDFQSAKQDYMNNIEIICIDCKSLTGTERLDNIKEVNEHEAMLASERYWDGQFHKAMAEKKKDAINPSHYQAYIQTEKEVLQWLEAMQYLPRFRDPECFKAAVELQARKYLDRNGGKDAELQELQKGLWYFKFLVAFIKNGNKPIRVTDIDKILNG